MTHIIPRSIDQALLDANLLGAALGDPASWQTWRAVLKATFGLELNCDEARAFGSVAGSRKPPQQRVRELWAIIGRRSGKSRMAAALAVYQACFVKHKLSAGERGMVLVLAASQDQARVVFSYAKAFLESSPVLRQEIADVMRSEIRLRNGVTIAIHSNSFRTIRGRTLCACIFDEVAMWRDESSAVPDVETYRSVLPALLTTKGMLVGISTGYRRVGLLYGKHRDYFGQSNDDTLVVQGGTQAFAELLKQYDIRSVTGDNYGAKWVSQYWREAGFDYEKSLWTRSEIYLEVMALFARKAVRLPDHQRMLRELRLLERSTNTGGRDAVNHGRNGHDDFSNVACGVLRLLDARRVAEAEVPIVAPGVYAGGRTISEPRVLTKVEAVEDGAVRANATRPPDHCSKIYQEQHEPWRGYVSGGYRRREPPGAVYGHGLPSWWGK